MSTIAMLFPGQGSQYAGMGRSICDHSLLARRVFEEASDALHIDLGRMCFEGNDEELAKTENTQPAILTVSVAAFKVIIEQTGIKPSYLAGHSLGEITALVCANGILFADAIKLVRLRGNYMQEATPPGSGLMIAVNGVDAAFVQQECDKFSRQDSLAVISNYNSPLQTVVSGKRETVELIGKSLSRSGARVIPLNVSAPFHSPLMRHAAERLSEHLSTLSYARLIYPVLSNITAFPYTNERCIPSMLTSQMVRPVQWLRSMKFLQLQGVDTVIDVGPGETLKNFMKRNGGIRNLLSFEKDEERVYTINQEQNSDTLALSEAEQKYTFIERCLAIAMCTPNNARTGEHQEQALSQYKSIKATLTRLKVEQREPTQEQMEDAREMLQAVFNARNTPIEEQKMRWAGLLRETGTTGRVPMTTKDAE